VIDVIEHDGRYRIAHLLDDNRTLHGKPFFGYKVAGATESILAMPEKRKPWVLVSIGDNAERARIAAWLRAKGFRFVGPTICYAFMQAVGMVNDHTMKCFRYDKV